MITSNQRVSRTGERHARELAGALLSALALAAMGGNPPAYLDDALVVTTATTLSGVTNCYQGLASAIYDNLTIEGTSYVRLKGGTDATLALGPADQAAANQCPVVTIQGNSGLYGSYRNSKGFLDETDTTAVRSKIVTTIGANGGAGKFVVKCQGSKFGSNISEIGLWLEDVVVSANATSSGDYIDVLQLDAGGVADLIHVVNENDKPARILFNGGRLRNNYMNHQGSANSQLSPAVGKTLVCESVNGNTIDIYKCFYGADLNCGMGTLRFQGNGDVSLKESGENLPGVGNANRQPHYLNPERGPIEWKQKGNLVLAGNEFLRCGADDQLPYKTETGIVWLQGKSILDLDGHSEKVRSLISSATDTVVSNAYHNYKSPETSIASTLVFGADDTDGIFNAVCCDNVNVEKIGTGTLVVSNVTMKGVLTIRSGKVMFVGRNNFAQPVVIADGVKVETPLIATADSIKTPSVGSLPEFAQPTKISFEKTGTDELLVYPGVEMDGMDIAVAGGTLRFTGASTDKWWRLVVNETAAVEINSFAKGSQMEISVFSLFPSNIVTAVYKDAKKHLNYGLKTNETGVAWTSYDQMPAGTCTEGFGETYRWDPGATGRKWWGVDTLCTSDSANVFLTTGTAISDAAPRHIVYRLKDDAAPVSSYTLGITQWSRSTAPRHWRLESSVNGVDWTVRDDHVAQWANTSDMTPDEARIASEIPNFTFGTAGIYNNLVPYRFTQGGTAADVFRPAVVRVAADATLDTSYIPDANLSFGALVVDVAAGAGTITKFSPSTGGVLDLVNVPAGRHLKGYVVPLTVDSVVNAANLATWTIRANGQLLKGYYLTVRGNRLVLHGGGLAISFR